jgi:hypothetical protein
MTALNIAFMGCGWRFPFLFGVAQYIQDHKYRLEEFSLKYIGVSGGSVVACSLQQDIVDVVYEKALSKRSECRYSPLGMCDFIESVANDCFEEVQPDLFIVASRVSGCSLLIPELIPEFMTDFESTDDLCRSMRASSHIPILGGSLTYKHRGRYFIDGEMSVSIDLLRDTYRSHVGEMLVVVDFCERADIKPSISFPRSWIFFPQNDETMEMMFQHGYERAKEYFESD